VNSILDVNRSWAEQNLRLLPAPGGNEYFVAWEWSLDGKKLIGNLSGPPLVVGYFSLETNQYERVTESGNGPMWLADSTRFLFTLNNKAYLGNIKTKRVREVFSSPDHEIRSVNISRDGEMLYFTIYSSESDIWLLDLN
jgi:hypothetical protein